MLLSLAAGQAAPQLLAAVRAGACGALASGVLRRGLAAMVEPTAFPPADRDSFHYAVLQAPLMKVVAVLWVLLVAGHGVLSAAARLSKPAWGWAVLRYCCPACLHPLCCPVCCLLLNSSCGAALADTWRPACFSSCALKS